MKKVYIIIFFVSFLLHTANAQTPDLFSAPINPEIKLKKLSSMPQKNISSPLTISSLLLYYDTADAYNYNIANNRYIWDMNMNYKVQDTAIKYCVVAFDSLYDVYQLDFNGDPPVDWAYKNVTDVTVDSIITIVGQVNHSGIDDTLRLKIVSVDAKGYPTATVLWEDSLIIPSGASLSPANKWTRAVALMFRPGYALVGTKKFAVRLEYYGAKQDTLGFVAGFQPKATNCAATTHFSKVGTTLTANSFVYWTHYGPTYGTFPTIAGNGLWTDCNQNGIYNPGVDGPSSIQNIRILSYVTINTNTGINEYTSNNGLSLLGAYPNPANDFTNIRYRIEEPTTVSVEIYDLTGRVIEQSSEKLFAGTHDIKVSLKDVAAGSYFYTIKTGSAQLTSKFIVTK